jgi:uncharacterized C2H2 Zn-finger protein
LNDSVQCPKCDKVVDIGKMDAEISEIGVVDHNVGFVARRFRATCPDCGPFFHDRVGHHCTITKKQMAQLFPKRQRRRLRDVLPEDERKPFMRTLIGKREPKDGEVEHWLAVQQAMKSTAAGGPL